MSMYIFYKTKENYGLDAYIEYDARESLQIFHSYF
jgi:hypothetical protein